MVLLALDGNSIMNRAFYGIKLLSTKEGRYTNAIYGFMNILLNLKENFQPDAIAVAFDKKSPTFRHKIYDAYKAGRAKTPPELLEQFPIIKEILAAMGICTIEMDGWEADDILGTLSVCPFEHVYIATGDRDSLQLISDSTSILYSSTKAGRPQTVIYNREKLMEDYGLSPERMIDLKALMGDASDNLPGVAGIGQKTATDLIQRYGTLEEIYRNLDSLTLTKSVRAKLEAGKDNAFLSYRLGTISKEVPINLSPETYLIHEGNPKQLRKILIELEMFKMCDRLNLGPELDEEKNATKRKKLNYIENPSPDLLFSGKEIFFLTEFQEYTPIRLIATDGEFIFSFEKGVSELLLHLLLEQSIKKYTSSSKSLYRFAFEQKQRAVGIVFDCEIAGYLLNPNTSDYSVMTIAADNKCSIPELEGFSGEMDSLLTSVALLPSVAEVLDKTIEENEQSFLFFDVELPLAEVLASMEFYGFRVDTEGLSLYSEKLIHKIKELELSIYEDAGESFNINSPKQLGNILFEKLGLPAKKKTKTGYSTNAEILESLAPAHPIVAKVLEYRTLAKLKSTYCDSLIQVADKDGRIHSTFNQTETRTGRISNSEPNLQNIPVRTDIGRELRRFFIADNGFCLADSDYSQIELRVLADLADDKAMISAFNQGEDIHAVTASEVFSIPLSMVTDSLRRRAKAVNFGIVYGIGAFSLAKDIGVSIKEADHYIKAYLAHYAGVNAFMDHSIKYAKENGYAQTIFHRRRYLPELFASNAIQRSFGERVARNMPIQGTAADIIKIAMVRVFDRIRKEGLRSRLILQVHDELIIETAEGEEEAVRTLLSQEMENAFQGKVKLSADVHFGKSWYDAKE